MSYGLEFEEVGIHGGGGVEKNIRLVWVCKPRSRREIGVRPRFTGPSLGIGPTA